MVITWALKRQLFYILVVLAFFLIFGGLILSSYLNKPPTCFDGKKNGMEGGVDCGGGCQLACSEEVNDISILWSRTFKVLPGRYNAMAYLESRNENMAVRKINYRFRFADSDNIYIGKREGSAYLPSSGKFAIFEPAVDLGNSVPVYTSFEFTENPVWERVDPGKLRQLVVSVSDISLVDQDTSPRLFANIRNHSLFEIPKVWVIAILYDALGNVISASRTFIEVLPGESSVPVSFTWPEPFLNEAAIKEVIPMYDVFGVELK